MSRTDIEKRHVLLTPVDPYAVQLTMLGLFARLIGKDAPLVPLHTVDVIVPLVVYAVGFEKMGSPVVDPGSGEIVMFDGQMIVTGSESMV